MRSFRRTTARHECVGLTHNHAESDSYVAIAPRFWAGETYSAQKHAPAEPHLGRDSLVRSLRLEYAER